MWGSPKKSQIHPHLPLLLRHACRAAMIRMTVLLLLALLAIQAWAPETTGMPSPIPQGTISSSSSSSLSSLRFVQDRNDPSRQIRRRKMQETNLGEDAETTNSTNVDAEGDSTAGEDGGDDLFYYPISLEYVVAVAGPTKGLPLPLIRDKQTWLNDAVDVMVQEEIAELQGRRKLFRGRQLQTSTNILYMTSAQVVDWSLLSSSSSCRASSAWTCWKVQQSLSIQQQEVSLTSGRPVDQTGPSFGRTILDWKERDVTSNAQRLEEGLKARILQQLSVQDDKDSVTTTISLEFQDLLRDTVPDDISAVASLLSDGDTISLLNDNATDVDDSNEKMKAWAIVLIVLAILLCLTGLCYGCDRYTASTSLEGPTTTQRLRAGLQKAAQMVTRNPQYDQNTKAVNMAGEILEANNNVMEDDLSSDEDSMVADMQKEG